MLVVCSALLCATFVALVPIDRVYRQHVVYGQPIDPATGQRWIVSAAMDRDGLALEADHDHRVNPRYEPLVGWHGYARRYPPGVGGYISTWGAEGKWLGFAWSD